MTTENKADWIDKLIRDLCEMPDRTSPEGDPDAIVATPIEIRAVIESNLPFRVTDVERQAIGSLLTLAKVTLIAMDDSEEMSSGKALLESNHAKAIGTALDSLSELPDDRPGYVMSEVAKAAWALRNLMLNNLLTD